MHFFLAPYVGAGTNDSPFRPHGVDQAAAAGRPWTSIDLRADPARPGGWALLATDAHLPPALNRFHLADDPEAEMSEWARRMLATRTGAPPAATRLCDAVPELLLHRLTPTAWPGGWCLRAHRIVLGGWEWTQPVVRGGAGYLDDFDRASLGADWTVATGTWGLTSNALIRSGVAIGSADAVVRYAQALDSDDHYCQIDYVNNGGNDNAYLGPAVRMSTDGLTYYRALSRAGGSARELAKVVAGTVTSLASDTSGGGPTRTLKLEVSGSTVSFFDHGVLAFEVTDASITGNVHVGVVAHPVAGGNPLGDNFQAADVDAAGAYVLKFDLSPDATETPGGGSADTSTIRVSMVVDGVEHDLGLAASPPEAPPDGEYTWGERSMSVSGIFDPDAAELYVRWRWVTGLDTGHVRLMRVEGPGGAVWRDQYGTYDATEAGFDGGLDPGQRDPCSLSRVIVDPYGDGHVRHIFFPPVVCGGVKTWDGSAWILRPVKTWDGSAWIERPVSVWDGASW